jgi:hypothetical protein
LKTKCTINRKCKRMRNRMQKGSSLVEALVSIAIIAYIVVTILSGISQKKLISQNTGDKNAAVYLAESRLEDLIKFSCDQLVEGNQVEYIIFKGYGFQVFTEAQGDPGALRQFRRTIDIQKDLVGRMATLRVTVEYGATPEKQGSNTLIYPYRIELSTRRTVQ